MRQMTISEFRSRFGKDTTEPVEVVSYGKPVGRWLPVGMFGDNSDEKASENATENASKDPVVKSKPVPNKPKPDDLPDISSTSKKSSQNGTSDFILAQRKAQKDRDSWLSKVNRKS